MAGAYYNLPDKFTTDFSKVDDIVNSTQYKQYKGLLTTLKVTSDKLPQ
jgi:hypothetical protein